MCLDVGCLAASKIIIIYDHLLDCHWYCSKGITAKPLGPLQQDCMRNTANAALTR